MSGVSLKPRATLEARVDLSGITPAVTCPLTLRELEGLSVPYGAKSVPLAELFFIEGAPEGVLLIEIGDSRLDGVGAGMLEGELIVDGVVGAWAGRGMGGGVLRIAGDAGDFLGAELSGGRIELAGNAGAHAGGATSGSRRGMSGGVLKIGGNAGPRAAERQRGGLIVIGGDAGEGLATDMIAGTASVGGTIGPLMGRGMKRGTVFTRTVPELPAGFVDTGEQELVALQLLARRVPELKAVIGQSTRARRLVGDTLLGGQGELLVPA
ncbi:formylmethanofuran dehydrogenase subunit C [Ancylobacter novellus DSM 506]|uniref:Formylmethanofuran dehydrogenase subunit C n=1 Tax=Ancylobacter novellus (strain ATCC 8093 / DSM 506 / JCM 20403 / CCM 1077 / IAM 12100 / NBRC 12443 / NCIMB 10456) TaxID=639283 RepID=D7A5G5_ANCN5|nr:formylmethanofuran dehydrogenase subunit C [Ancylobacter novellus]ADH88089.1 formylmethanofuran dehydrogenase subunit C [Ancylobacter novellus DSM 506]